MRFSEINRSQIYFGLKDISGCENFFSRSEGSENCKKKQKKHVECFFQFLMLNVSSIKELLHKPLEIQ